jgi:hypothetical protein
MHSGETLHVVKQLSKLRLETVYVNIKFIIFDRIKIQSMCTIKYVFIAVSTPRCICKVFDLEQIPIPNKICVSFL